MGRGGCDNVITAMNLRTGHKKFLYKDPQRTDQPGKRQDKANEEPGAGTTLSQTALCVCVTSDLSCRYGIDPVYKSMCLKSKEQV